ncbi:hypothetical protein HELRODRAFT_102849 [Helobdella robusta]|uniref:Uncharacterized protein n=1 Tax=Helobdella robusta TaxID=6412 RepID=T1EDC4_HELRO|nr:hypothetical protein HELRODRAFT_102849 [Helobdella robusta]ESN95030.1 hypothetical protein HELRODRAFT_102849 [Helobdella robusta]
MYSSRNHNFHGGYQADYHGRLIASKTLKLETKRYYIDVKETDRFMFLKLTEIETGGRKSKITLDLQSAADFHFMLTEFNEFYTNLGPRTSNAGRRDEMAPLKSDSFTSKDRKIFLDLKENKWGRFLKVTMTVSLGREKHKLIIPAQGMTELIDAFTELLREADAKIKKGDLDKEKKKNDVDEEGEDRSADDNKDSRSNVDRDEKRDGEENEEREGKRKRDVVSSSEQSAGGSNDDNRNDKKVKKSHLSYGDQYLEVNVNKNSRGTFLRITEVNDNIEKSVSVPQEFWMNFLKKLKKSINDNNVDAINNNNNNINDIDQQQQQEYYDKQQQHYDQQSNTVFESLNSIDLVNINE